MVIKLIMRILSNRSGFDNGVILNLIQDQILNQVDAEIPCPQCYA